MLSYKANDTLGNIGIKINQSHNNYELKPWIEVTLLFYLTQSPLSKNLEIQSTFFSTKISWIQASLKYKPHMILKK